MILIDEAANERLVKALEALIPNPDRARCLHFNFTVQALQNDSDRKTTQRRILALINQHLGSPDLQVFLCPDGDMFILAPIMTTKAARHLIVDVAGLLKLSNVDGFAQFYQLHGQMNKILQLAEERLARWRSTVERLKQQQVAEQVKSKRSEILHPALVKDQTPTGIAERRRQRSHAEIMLIEDDVFTKRLVENVLGKDFRLTSLTTTEHALITYVSLAPDILFLDIGLPNVSGHELLERILAIDPNAFVIMLSGSADKVNVTRALKFGAKGFIAKPFTREKIMQYIEHCPTIKH